MHDLFAKKSMATIQEQSDHSKLKRTLNGYSLIMLGIGAIIGAGLFIRTAAAAAENAGSAVTLSYLLAAFGCTFAGLCYAEFASRIPIAGSAYTYTYVIMGEIIAWIIGWNLILEYALGAATVSIAWSEYLNKLLGYIHINGHPFTIPYEWIHSPMETAYDENGVLIRGIMNIPAFIITSIISLLLVRGMSDSASFNNVMVGLKLIIVVLFIFVGWQFINPENHIPYIPPPSIYTDDVGIAHHFGGLEGIIGGAGVVFFAFIGFDAVSTAAQETVNPKRNMPIGILGSLVICTVLYVLFSYVLTGVANTQELRTAGAEASVTYAIQTYMTGYEWMAKFVTVAILLGLTSVMLVLLMAQSRIFYSMSKDRLLPGWFSDIHPKYKTPYKSTLLIAVFVGLLSAFLPGDLIGDMTSIGTLFAFILVCAGIILLRHKESRNSDYQKLEAQPGFKTPWVPLVPLLGIATCSLMIYGLGYLNWLRLFLWIGIGLIIYFCYSRYRN